MPVTTRSRTRAQLAEAAVEPPKVAAFSATATHPDHSTGALLPVVSLLSDDDHISAVGTKASTARKRANRETQDAEQALTLDQAEDVEEDLAPPPKKQAKKPTAKKAKPIPTKPKPKPTVAPAKKGVSGWSRGRLTEEQKDSNRLRKWEETAPESYMKIRRRALEQRMFVVDRIRGGTEQSPEEVVELAGSTGNVYTISIRKVPKCTCPQGRFGKYCKHIVYVISQVLKAKGPLAHQFEFLARELHEIFAAAPIPSQEPHDTDGRRKPIDDDDCPICCCEMAEDKETIVWCKAACGNNLHQTCFDQWAATKRSMGSKVTCPYCRTAWQNSAQETSSMGGPMKELATRGLKNHEGYVNIGSQLGLSEKRDYRMERDWV